MFKRIGYWFFLLVLSFILASCGFGVQGQMFLYLFAGMDSLVTFLTNLDHPFGAILVIGIAYGIVFFLTWIISQVLSVDFYIVFEILSFGLILFTNNN